MFGLEDVCCVLPFDNDFQSNHFINYEPDTIAQIYKHAVDKMNTCKYVICGWQIRSNHFVSVVSL